MLVVYAIAGACASTLIGSVMPKLVASWFAPSARAKCMMLYTMGPTVTGAIFGIVIPIMLSSSGWRLVYISVGILCIVLGCIFLLLCRNTPEEMGTIPFGYTAEEAKVLSDTAAIQDSENSMGKAFVKVLKYKGTWIFGLIYALWMAYFASANTYGTPALMYVGFDTTVVGLINTMTMVIVVFSQILFSSLSDRYWSRKAWLSSVCIICGAIQVGLFFILQTPADQISLPFLFFYMGVMGFFTGQGALLNTINAEVFPPSLRATGPAVVATITMLGAVIGPLAAGAVMGSNGGFIPVYLLFSGPCLIVASILLWIFIPATGGKHGDPLAIQEAQETLGDAGALKETDKADA